MSSDYVSLNSNLITVDKGQLQMENTKSDSRSFFKFGLIVFVTVLFGASVIIIGTVFSPIKKDGTALAISMPAVNDAAFTTTFAALGDWGVTDSSAHDSVTQGKTVGTADYTRSFNAQTTIATNLNTWASQNKPLFVLSQGDNMYWTGVSDTGDYRWGKMFEDLYSDASLYVPWYNVLGNHDYGGGSGFCGKSCWNCGTLCSTTSEMETALNQKFYAQRDYKSPHNDRWKLTNHYYTALHTTSDFTVEIFNIDTNAAGNRLFEICCQCFSTTESPHCDNPSSGNANCINGDTAQYAKCEEIIQGWWSDSMTQLDRDLKASTATWKIVNNHYLLKHFTPAQSSQVQTILADGGAHIFIGGHEHAEGHDLMNGIHYLQNGGGGGAKAAGGSGNVWSKNTYGWMAGRISSEWLQVQFFDDYNNMIHCYNIPNNIDLSKQSGANTQYIC